MLELPDVTLCCIDTRNHALALRALARSRDGVRFARALLLTDALPAGVAAPEGVDVVPGVDIVAREAYSEFVLKSLLPHIATTHVLLVQWDGYVINPAAWDPAFLACDYIGAKWFWHDDGMRVGNGGFSLRSRRLLEALQDSRIVLADAEDTTIGRTFRPLLEREHGIRFADEALADRFSFEAAYPIGKPFGFHGLFNFCRTVAPEEIAVLAPQFSDAIARSPQLLQLMRNCSALAQWNAVSAIATRILAAAPGHAEAATLLATCMRQAQAAPAAGRNEPCPCGSGKRYKQCHGALGMGDTRVSATMPARSPDPDTLVRAALAAHQRGELDRAESGYRGALAAMPEHPLALHYLGVILYQRHRLDEAMPLLERAATASPGEPEFQNNLGLALAAADRNDEAVAAYRRALALKPDHAVASNNLGLALQASNRLPEAIAAYRERTRRCTRFRGGPLEPLPRAARAWGVRRRLARVRMAAVHRQTRQARARLREPALGRQRITGTDTARLQPSKGSGTRCNSSASRRHWRNAGCASSSSPRRRSCRCWRPRRGLRWRSDPTIRCPGTTRTSPCCRCLARSASARTTSRRPFRTSLPHPRAARRPLRRSSRTAAH